MSVLMSVPKFGPGLAERRAPKKLPRLNLPTVKASKQKKIQEFIPNAKGNPQMHALRIKLFGNDLKNEPGDEYMNNYHLHVQIKLGLMNRHLDSNADASS